MSIARSFPLLLLPLLVYNLIAFLNPWTVDDTLACAEALGFAVHPLTCQLDVSLLSVPTAATMALSPAHAVQPLFWAVTMGDLLLVFSLVLLFFEMLKSTSSSSSSVINHALSMMVFVAGVVEFLMVPACTTSVFFLITLMALLDVLAGFIVTISAARRDLQVT